MVIRFVIASDEIEPPAISTAVAALADRGIVAYPTDTFYGLAVDPRNADAVRRLFEAKGRAPDQATPLIAATLIQAEEAVEFNDVARRLALRFWPGPLSLVLPARPAIDRGALGGGRTAAIRVPAQPLAQALARGAGFSITATSANLSGQPPPQTAFDIADPLLEHVAVLLDGGITPGGAPSTIVDVSEGIPRLVRAGLTAWERVLESLQ